MKKALFLSLLTLMCCFSINAQAFTKLQRATPVGYWLTIDDKTNQPRGIVYIYPVKNKQGVTLRGKTIAGLYIPGQSWKKDCSGCIAPWTNHPMEGLVFMWHFQKSGYAWSSPWINGKIFDPNSKKDIYRSKIWLTNNGLNLKLRGYEFIFYRTQTWTRLTKKQMERYVAKAKRQIKQHPLT